jgi:hypothetical protein
LREQLPFSYSPAEQKYCQHLDKWQTDREIIQGSILSEAAVSERGQDA